MSRLKGTFGIFRNRDDVRGAINSLRRKGFSRDEIAVLFPDDEGKGFAYNHGTLILHGALIGAVVGFVFGGVVGSAIFNKVISIPGLINYAGFDLGAHVLIGAVCGGVLGAAVGTLVGIGVPEPISQRYRRYVRSGGILLSVLVGDEENQKTAEQILGQADGEEIATMSIVKGWGAVIGKERLDKEMNLEEKNGLAFH